MAKLVRHFSSPARHALIERFREGDVIIIRVDGYDLLYLGAGKMLAGVDLDTIEVGDDLAERAYRESAGTGAGAFRQLIDLEPAPRGKLPFRRFRHGGRIRRATEDFFIPGDCRLQVLHRKAGERIVDRHG